MRRWRALVLVALACCAPPAPALEPARPAQASPPPALPPVVPTSGAGVLIVSCDPGGCWDEFGVRYDRADAGVFIRKDGRSCLAVKGRMRCE